MSKTEEVQNNDQQGLTKEEKMKKINLLFQNQKKNNRKVWRIFFQKQMNIGKIIIKY